MSSSDVESLQPASRTRSRCLDVFLLGSVITLFVMVLSVAALGFWMVTDLRAKLDPRVPAGILSAMKSHQEGPPVLDYKMQNFAYLAPNSESLKNGSMEWKPNPYRNGTTVGSRFSYDSNHHALTMVQEGTYFLYTKLNLSCVGPCASGSLKVTFVDDKDVKLLSCSVHLTHPGPSVSNCWDVIPHLPARKRMMAKMHTSVPPAGWRLDSNRSGFGMFLVDGPRTEKEKKTEPLP